MEAEDKVYADARAKIILGEELRKSFLEFKEIAGVSKLQKKINQELTFLEKVIRTKTLKENHLTSSNFANYEFLIKTLRLQHGVVSVNAVFPLESRQSPLRVDIVANNGLKWIKAVARNSKSIEDAAKGIASYGARSILDQADDYLEASELNFCNFQRPKIVFYFSNNIDSSVKNDLEGLGVHTASLESPHLNVDQDESMSNELNLDVSTMLAYVSSLTNGRCNLVFEHRVLTEHAEMERKLAVKPVLEQLFESKRLVCCQLAYDAFQKILAVVGGPNEQKRAVEFLKRVHVYPDVEAIPEELSHLQITAQVTERSLKIFSFGIERKVITVTANKAFVRSAKMQRIDVPAFVHESRALTEGKEVTAKPL